MMTISVWNLLTMTMKKTKKTKMLLEQHASKVPADADEIPVDETTKKSEDNTSIHSRENNEVGKKEKKSQKSPLIVMKKTWNPRILMTMMNKWILQETGEPTTFASSL